MTVVRHADAPGLDGDRLVAFVARTHGAPADRVTLDVRPLRGGLESTAVARVRARVIDREGRERWPAFVVKRLVGTETREAAVYEALADQRVAAAPRLLGTEWLGADTAYLYVESVASAQRWPWTDPARAGMVLDRLAALHATVSTEAAVLADWNYEAELEWSAGATLAVLEGLYAPGAAELRRALPSLRRVVAALPAMRRALLNAPPFGVAVLHGDVHPGNAVLRRHGAGEQAVLLDWGRARLGSPLEDVASWLRSVCCWEPEARRRHDTLLRRYLRARGWPDRLDPAVREAYWLAAASNGLSGALRYHLAIVGGWGDPPPSARQTAWWAAWDWLRVVRGADAYWRRGPAAGEPRS